MITNQLKQKKMEDIVNETKREAYLIRSKPDGRDREANFLDGELSIGWPFGKSLKGKTKEEISYQMKKKWPVISSLDVTQCYNFASIPKGSIVLTPSLKNPAKIHIFKTISTYIYKHEHESAGNPHHIFATHIKTVSRSEFSETFKRSMKAARRTVTVMSKYIDDILKTVGHDVIDYEPDPAVLTKIEETEKTILTDKNKSCREQEMNLSDDKAAARAVLKELLKSDDESTRLQAALALMKDK